MGKTGVVHVANAGDGWDGQGQSGWWGDPWQPHDHTSCGQHLLVFGDGLCATVARQWLTIQAHQVSMQVGQCGPSTDLQLCRLQLLGRLNLPGNSPESEI